MIRRRLLIFSFAAPLGAVITFFIVKAFGWGGVGQVSGEVDSLGWWTGIALLFSVSTLQSLDHTLAPLLRVSQIADCFRAGHSSMSLLSSNHFHPTLTRITMRPMTIPWNWGNTNEQDY